MSSQEITVKRASRKIKRDINKILSNNFLKIITEIVLNSDDSYKRIERTETERIVKNIKIQIHRHKKEVSVIDYAEGLSIDEMKDIFSEYGGEHSEGTVYENVRGLFGQGASDVLFFGSQQANKGEIRSIKNGILHSCRFIIKDEQKLKLNIIDNEKNIQNFKQKYDIEDRGTVVSFGLGDKVPIPHKSQIKEKIESFYMLRFLLTDPIRLVTVEHDGITDRLSAERFKYNEENLLLNDLKVSYSFENRPINCSITVYENKENFKEEKIIITDEYNRVYDNTLFGLENYPGANRLRGIVVVKNLYNILSDYLNSDQPEEILRDSRDGFDQRHRFTEMLFGKIRPILIEQIKILNDKYNEKQYDLSKNRVVKNAISHINDIVRKMQLEEIGNLESGKSPPSDGIKFVREQIFMTVGKSYTLQLLINPNIIKPNDEIDIYLSEYSFVDLITTNIKYDTEDIDVYGLVTKNVVLRAIRITTHPIIITAESNDSKSKTRINVVKEEVRYPSDGIAFIPDKIRIVEDKPYVLKLFLDTSKFVIGSEVFLSSKSDRQLISDEFSIKLEASHLINEGIAIINVDFSGGHLGETYFYSANCLNIEANATIKIIEKKEKDKGLEGMFSGLDVIELDQPWQSIFDKNSGKIVINIGHFINKKLLKDLSIENLKNLKINETQFNVIFDLVSMECSRNIIDKKIQKGQLQEDIETYNNETQRLKTELFKVIYKEYGNQ